MHSTARLIVNRAAHEDRVRDRQRPHREVAESEPRHCWNSPPTSRAGLADPATVKTLDARALGVEGVARAVDRPPVGRADRGRAGRRRHRGRRPRCAATPRSSTIPSRFDRLRPASAAGLAIAPAELEAAERQIEPAVRAALAYAAERIERYHAAALPKSWRITDEHGSHPRPGGAAARPGRHLRARRPCRLPLDGADDGGARARGWRAGDRPGHAARAEGRRAGRGAGRGPRGRRDGRLPRGRRPGGGRARLRYRHHPPRGQDRRARQRLRGARQDAACSATSASTWWPARARSW